MKMNKYIITSVLLWISIASFSQSNTTYTRYKFFKRNGIVLVGEILEKDLDKPYKIKLDNGVLTELREEELVKVVPLSDTRSNRAPFAKPSYKWAINTELMGLSNGNFNIGTPGIATAVAMSGQRMINYNVAVGAGVGMYNYDLDARRLVIPLFAEVKYRFIKNYSSPILQFRSGYSFASKNFINGLIDKNGGMFYNPFLGYEFGMDKKIGFTMGIGVVLQNVYYAYQSGTTFADEDILFRRTEFKIGLSIH